MKSKILKAYLGSGRKRVSSYFDPVVGEIENYDTIKMIIPTTSETHAKSVFKQCYPNLDKVSIEVLYEIGELK